MYKIEKMSWGYKLTFGDNISAEEMATWVKESEKTLISAPSHFGIFVDMRTLKPLAPETQAEMQKGQKLYKMKGMERSCVVLNSHLLTMQFKRIAQDTGIYQWERYIDASKNPDFESIGIQWLTNAKDPDLS